jgi:transposase
MLSGIISVIRHGLQWRDAPPGYGPHTTLHTRFVRWSRMGVFDRIFAALAGKAAQNGAFPRCIGRTKGGLNATLHAVCDGQGRPVILLVTEGRASDHRGAALMLPKLPPPKVLIADRGYDSARSRAKLTRRGIAAWIPQPAPASTPSRKT